MFILCALHQVVLTKYLTHFNCCYVFPTLGEEDFEDAVSENVVQESDTKLEALRNDIDFIFTLNDLCSQQ